MDVRHAKLFAQVGQEAAREGRNDVKSRWKRAVFLATQLTNGRGVITGGTKYDKGSPQAKRTKALETQHWLELIDSKHRYGSNCRSMLHFYSWEGSIVVNVRSEILS